VHDERHDDRTGPLTASLIQWVAASNLIWASYPDADDWIVYNPASADIHLLTPFAQSLLRVATQTPCTLDSLTQLLAQELALPVDAELRAAIESAIASLDRAGLVLPLLTPAE
jgi:PqqD family protein of HPr-rel-A system